MKKIFISILIILFTSNCNFEKRVDHHGVNLLKKKSDLIVVSKSNKNDITKLLGPPSVKSTFNNDLYFYIERKTTTDKLIKLGKKKFLENNVLILEIDNKGILVKKDFFDINNLNNYKFNEDKTEITYSKKSFVYDFLSSLRQKIDAPIKKKKNKR